MLYYALLLLLFCLTRIWFGLVFFFRLCGSHISKGRLDFVVQVFGFYVGDSGDVAMWMEPLFWLKLIF